MRKQHVKCGPPADLLDCRISIKMTSQRSFVCLVFGAGYLISVPVTYPVDRYEESLMGTCIWVRCQERFKVCGPRIQTFCIEKDSHVRDLRNVYVAWYRKCSAYFSILC